MTSLFSPRALVASALTLFSIAASGQTPPPGEPPAPPPPTEVAAPAAAPAVEETYPRMGKNHELMVGKNAWLRFGIQAQIWADWLQSATPVNGSDGKFSQNFFLRRARLIVGSQFFPGVSAYMVLDAPRLGLATAGGTAEAPTSTKRFNGQDGGGELIADAWGEIKIAGDAFILTGGLQYLPFGRNELTSSTTNFTLDGGNTSALVPNTSASRDVGLQLKGYLLGDHFEYRIGVFSGARQAANAAEGNPVGHNFFRVTGYLQYDIFDTEKGYIYAGHNYGKKKILGVGVGFDAQKNDAPLTDAYWAASAAVFGAWPLAGPDKAGGDELAFVAQYYHYDGGGTTGAIPGLFRQNDFLGEVAYYNKALSFGVFGKFEMQRFSRDADKAGNTLWFGGGLRYYIFENVCHITLAYNRVQFPDAPTSGTGARNSTNEITLQTQFYYY